MSRVTGNCHARFLGEGGGREAAPLTRLPGRPVKAIVGLQPYLPVRAPNPGDPHRMSLAPEPYRARVAPVPVVA
ncbi:MAG: hypothetical protein QGD91_12720, partial [Actinomycetota bacterium]|nr:hypothetical protein [Actinomycetota bacterium]